MLIAFYDKEVQDDFKQCPIVWLILRFMANGQGWKEVVVRQVGFDGFNSSDNWIVIPVLKRSQNHGCGCCQTGYDEKSLEKWIDYVIIDSQSLEQIITQNNFRMNPFPCFKYLKP